jgi:hypothetical protein
LFIAAWSLASPCADEGVSYSSSFFSATILSQVFIVSWFCYISTTIPLSAMVARKYQENVIDGTTISSGSSKPMLDHLSTMIFITRTIVDKWSNYQQ